jgi:hypothetical protein
MSIIRRLATILTLVSILALASSARATEVSVFATGLDAPRGLTFGPDGALYVAEAGSGGTATTANVCPELQLPPPLGPVMNGPTARISRVGPGGVRSTIVDGLPSSVTQLGGDYVGVADVAFVKRRLYAVVAGGGCSNGEADPNRPNGVIRIDHPGSWSYVANLSAYYMAHPVANPEPADFTPDGVPYDVVAKGGAIYILEVRSPDFAGLRGRSKGYPCRRPGNSPRMAPSRARRARSAAPGHRSRTRTAVMSLSDSHNRMTSMASWIETGTSRLAGACGSQPPGCGP